MAKAEAKDRTWVVLKQYAEQKASEVGSLDAAKRMISKELIERKHPYRYLDSDGVLHDEPLHLEEVDINFESSSAIKHAKPTRNFTVPGYDEPLRVARGLFGRAQSSPPSGKPISDSQLSELKAIKMWLLASAAASLANEAGYQIYKIEVLVPWECIVGPQSIASAVKPVNLEPQLTAEPAKKFIPVSGRPAYLYRISNEARRRLKADEIEPGTSQVQFARDLISWWLGVRHTIPGLPESAKIGKPSEKAVATEIRSDWNDWRQRQKA